MAKTGDKARGAFPKWAFDAVVTIYNERRGGYDTVDCKAVAKILDQFSDVSEEAKRDLDMYAAMVTR